MFKVGDPISPFPAQSVDLAKFCEAL